MTTTTARNRHRIAALALVSVAAIALGACRPKVAPAPPPPPPPPAAPTVNCTAGATLSDAVEQCHLQYRGYTLDTANSAAEAKAQSLIGMTPSQCSSSLASFHTGSALMGQYPGSSSVAENLYCLYFSNGSCAGAQFGATRAMNGWLASAGHKANLDAFAGFSVNAAAACNPVSNGGTGVYVAVAHFHNP